MRKSPTAEDIPSTSSSVLNVATVDVLEQLDVQSVAPWVLDRLQDGEIKLNLWDGVHSIAKYTLDVNTSLEFTVLVYNWPPSRGSLYLF